MSEKVSRRKYLKIAGGAVAAAALGTAGYYLTKSQPTTPMSTTTTAAPTTSAAAGSIKVGVVADLTGPGAADGTVLANGIRLAISEINASGGIMVGGKRHTIEGIFGDSETKVEVANSVVLKQIQQDKINVGIGYLQSTLFLGVMDIYERYKVPIMDTCAASRTIYDNIKSKSMKYIFMASPSSGDIADAMVRSAVNWFKPKTAALMHNETEGGRNSADYVKTWLTTNRPDIKIVAEEYPPLAETNFTPVLSKIKSANPDLLTVDFTGDGVNAALFQQAYELKLPAAISHNGASVVAQDFISKYGKYLEGNFALTRIVIGKVYTPKTQAFYDGYRKMFNSDPIQWAIQSYDGMYILADGIQRAGSLDPDAISNALLQTHYTGAWKKDWSFEKDTHRSPAELAVSQFQSGKLVPMWPLDIAEKFMPVPPYCWQK